MEYHIYKNNKSSILFFTEYKQAIRITEDDYAKTQKGEKERFNIYNKYKEALYASTPSSDILPKKDYVYELYLCVANDCNMKCIYCFAHQGDYGKEKGLMTKDIAKKSLDYFFGKVPESCKAVITFFGGEPLMAYNIIEYSCEYIKATYAEREYELHITTNGTLLTQDRIDYLIANHFKIAISIDGGEDIQNVQRPLASGDNSFCTICNNVEYAINQKAKVLARGTYSNFEYSLKKSYDDLLKINFSEVNIVPDIMNMKTGEQCKLLLTQLDLLYAYMLEYLNSKNSFPFGLFKMRVRELFLPKVQWEGNCGAGKTAVAVDIKGDIYPCHRHSGDMTTKMGNVFIKDKVSNFDFGILKEQCTDCWNRFTCSHGCYYEDKQLTGNYQEKNPFFCVYSKKMTELAINLCMDVDEEKLMIVLT